ncbi:hypothetical protein AGLY_003225 [Aphis glycines]|uniref:Uncharacterized protein n=1 Tax=Aphis glycines TaxID=307491 RepID=A0A6G0U2L1_APHGL|nr:hypothetical protein AGLY_003225 [Aphis glycines]
MSVAPPMFRLLLVVYQSTLQSYSFVKVMLIGKLLEFSMAKLISLVHYRGQKQLKFLTFLILRRIPTHELSENNSGRRLLDSRKNVASDNDEEEPDEKPPSTKQMVEALQIFFFGSFALSTHSVNRLKWLGPKLNYYKQYYAKSHRICKRFQFNLGFLSWRIMNIMKTIWISLISIASKPWSVLISTNIEKSKGNCWNSGNI